MSIKQNLVLSYGVAWALVVEEAGDTCRALAENLIHVHTWSHYIVFSVFPSSLEAREKAASLKPGRMGGRRE